MFAGASLTAPPLPPPAWLRASLTHCPLSCQVVRENEPDGMDGEQTWPTEQELMDAEMFAQQQRRKRVPKGTSAYQAAWILDDEGDDDEDDEGGSEEWEEAPEEGGWLGVWRLCYGAARLVGLCGAGV